MGGLIEASDAPLIVRGHAHWPEPLTELDSGVQVLNVDARVVILRESTEEEVCRILMPKPLKSRGRHLELPIVGYTLAELRLGTDRLVAVVFRNEAGAEARLEIEEAITLSRGRAMHILEGSRPGSTFAPQTLGPLVELLGCTVTDALAQRDGTIRVEMSNAMVLSIVPTHGYEGWHFYWRSKAHSESPWVLHGATGRLIVCD